MIGRFIVQLSKRVATISLPKSPTFISNFRKAVKICNLYSEIIFGQLLWSFGDFLLVTLHLELFCYIYLPCYTFQCVEVESFLACGFYRVILHTIKTVLKPTLLHKVSATKCLHKKTPNFNNSWPKSCQRRFYLKSNHFQNSPKSGYFCNKICHRELSNIA